MLYERLVTAINNEVREHHGIVPKYIAMNRKNYDLLKAEHNKCEQLHNGKMEDIIGIEKGSFFGIQIRIVEIEKEFELSFYVDPINKEVK